jgi:hypothetical protein
MRLGCRREIIRESFKKENVMIVTQNAEVSGSCEHGNEPPGYVKEGEYLDCITIGFWRYCVP